MKNAKEYKPSQTNHFLTKGIFLYFLILPIIFTPIISLFKVKIFLFFYTLISTIIFLVAIYIARVGFLAQKEYEKNTIAKAPKYPYKTIAAFLIGFGVFFSSHFLIKNDPLLSSILSICAFFGFYLYYGFDIKVDKIGNLSNQIKKDQIDEVIKVIKDAKIKTKALQNLSNITLHDEIKDRLNIIIKEINQIIDIIKSDPTTIKRVRKFFTIYLDRVEKITNEYTKNMKNNNINQEIEKNYIDLLKNFDVALKREKKRLKQKDLTMLDVQIEVLTKQLKQEGAIYGK